METTTKTVEEYEKNIDYQYIVRLKDLILSANRAEITEILNFNYQNPKSNKFFDFTTLVNEFFDDTEKIEIISQVPTFIGLRDGVTYDSVLVLFRPITSMFYRYDSATRESLLSSFVAKNLAPNTIARIVFELTKVGATAKEYNANTNRMLEMMSLIKAGYMEGIPMSKATSALTKEEQDELLALQEKRYQEALLKRSYDQSLNLEKTE